MIGAFIVGFALHQPFVRLMVIIFIGRGVAAAIHLPIERFDVWTSGGYYHHTLYPGARRRSKQRSPALEPH